MLRRKNRRPRTHRSEKSSAIQFGNRILFFVSPFLGLRDDTIGPREQIGGPYTRTAGVMRD